MAFIPVPNCVEVVITWTGGTKPFKTVLNVTSTVAWTIAAAEALASDVIDRIVTDALPWITNQLTAAFITMVDLSSSSGFSFNWTTGSGANHLPFTATGSPNLVWHDSALVTTLRTLNRGRSFRGRNYWPGLPSNYVMADGTHVSSVRVSDQDAFVNALIADIVAIPARKLVIVSRQTGGVARVTGVTTPVTSHDTNNIIDSQRRRTQP